MTEAPPWGRSRGQHESAPPQNAHSNPPNSQQVCTVWRMCGDFLSVCRYKTSAGYNLAINMSFICKVQSAYRVWIDGFCNSGTPFTNTDGLLILIFPPGFRFWSFRVLEPEAAITREPKCQWMRGNPSIRWFCAVGRQSAFSSWPLEALVLIRTCWAIWPMTVFFWMFFVVVHR